MKTSVNAEPETIFLFFIFRYDITFAKINR